MRVPGDGVVYGKNYAPGCTPLEKAGFSVALGGPQSTTTSGYRTVSPVLSRGISFRRRPARPRSAEVRTNRSCAAPFLVPRTALSAMPDSP
jgi:hypothetical protein